MILEKTVQRNFSLCLFIHTIMPTKQTGLKKKDKLPIKRAFMLLNKVQLMKSLKY